MLRPEIIRDLELTKHGLEMIPADPQKLFIYPDGTFLNASLDENIAKESVRKISEKDVQNWDAFWERLSKAAEILKPFLIQPPVTKSKIEETLRDHDLDDIAEYIFNKPIMPLLQKYFSNPRVIEFVAAGTLQTRYSQIDAPGTLYN